MKSLWIIKTDGRDYWEKKISEKQNGLENALSAWNSLTAAEQKKQVVQLVIGEEEEGVFDYSDYEILWDSSLQYVWNGYGYKTLEEAQKDAEHYATLTGENIRVYTPYGLSIRRWYGCMSGLELVEDPIVWNPAGFYGDWEEIDYMDGIQEYLTEEAEAISRT